MRPSTADICSSRQGRRPPPTSTSSARCSAVWCSPADAARRYRTERDPARCLQALVADAAERGDAQLVLEQENTLIAADRGWRYCAARDARCQTCATGTGYGDGELLALPTPDRAALPGIRIGLDLLVAWQSVLVHVCLLLSGLV